MHLPGYPRYYVKGDQRRAVYYTADARELLQAGWLPEEKTAKPESPEPEEIDLEEEIDGETEAGIEVETDEIIAPCLTSKDTEEEPIDFESMTKVELMEYAVKHGSKLQPAMAKAEMVEACKKL